MSTQTINAPQVTDPELEQEPPKVSHIVAREDDESADAIVLRSLVEGKPIVALCGAIFVSSRTPNLPVCEPCAEALADILKMREELS